MAVLIRSYSEGHTWIDEIIEFSQLLNYNSVNLLKNHLDVVEIEKAESIISIFKRYTFIAESNFHFLKVKEFPNCCAICKYFEVLDEYDKDCTYPHAGLSFNYDYFGVCSKFVKGDKVWGVYKEDYSY